MYKYTNIIKLQQWNKLILPTSVWVCRLRWTSSCSVRLYSCYWWSGWGRSRPSGILPYVQLLRYNIESWCGHFIVCTMWIWMIKSNILIRCITSKFCHYMYCIYHSKLFNIKRWINSTQLYMYYLTAYIQISASEFQIKGSK